MIPVVHAPHEGWKKADRQQYWGDLHELRNKWQPDFVGIDANGSVGFIQSEAVGPSGLREHEDSNGEMFHKLLLEPGLCALNTFGSPASDETYVSRKGTRSRIDDLLATADSSPLVKNVESFMTLRRGRNTRIISMWWPSLNGPSRPPPPDQADQC